MHADQHIWRGWIISIHRWGLQNWVASLLESAGPLTILGAQMIYLFQPLLESSLLNGQLNAAARLLEEPSITKEFVDLLREES